MSSSRSVLALGLSLVLAMPFVPTDSAASSLSLARAGGAIVFTFDGGYATDVGAASVLAAHGVHGTFYVASGLLRQGPWYTDYLSAQDVANLSAAGHDIESMTVTAPDLTTVSDAQLASELNDSRAALAGITGRPVGHLAYPYGDADARVKAAAATSYLTGRILTGSVQDFLASPDPYALPGLMITTSTNLTTAESYVDFAVAHNTTVILEMERIGTSGWNASNLDALAGYAVARGVATPTMADLEAPVATVPQAPAITASPGNGFVSLAWTTPGSGGSPVQGYRLYRALAGGSPTFYASVNGTTYSDANVQRNGTYTYQVSAVNAVGEGPLSNAATASPTSGIVPYGAALVYTFDDGFANGTRAAQILEAHGQHGTFYVSPQLLHQGVWYTDYLSSPDLLSLDLRGHEIGSMTMTERDLTTLSPDNVTSELRDSQYVLERMLAHPVTDLAYPFGDANASVASTAATYYASARGLSFDINDFAAPADVHRLPGLLVQNATSLAAAEGYVDFAVAHGVPVVLTFERINDNPGTWDWSASRLDALAAYVQSKGVPVLTMGQLVAGAPPAPPSAPGAPVLDAIPGDGVVNLTWMTPDNHGSPITGYQIYSGPDAGNLTLLATVGVTSSYLDSSVANDQTYAYAVRAINKLGVGPFSNAPSATPNKNGIPPGAAIVFTFDDGDRSQLQAVKVLQKAKMSATFYVLAGALRNDSTGDNPESMSAAEVAQLAKQGFDVESHTMQEIDATSLSPAGLDATLRDSKYALQNITGKPVDYMAWPGGAHNLQTEAAAALYYKSSRIYNSDITVATAHENDRQAVPCMGVFANDTSALVDSYVDYAVSHNVTVILAIHNLAPVPASYGVQLDNYDWNLQAFQQVVSYVKQQHVPVKTIADLGNAGRMPPN